MGKRLARMAALLAGTVSLGGCVVFQSPPTATQQGIIGPVQVSLTLCATPGGSPPAGACPGPGNAGGGEHPVSEPSQLFIGFRVPNGTGVPRLFTTSSGPDLVFTVNSEYAEELQRLDPAPSGEEWIGYTSQYFSYNNASGEQNLTASVTFGLPTNANGSPYAGPFTWQAVVGGRQFNAGSTPDPTEPIDCGNSLTTGWGLEGQTSTTDLTVICVDDPPPATFNSDNSLTIRNAGISPGASVSAPAGTTATVPFTFGYAGSATAAASFTLSSTIALGGVTPTKNPSTITPASAGTTPVTVSVPIPLKAPLGSYPVTLTANLGDGESRMGTASLTVLPPPKCKVPNLVGKTVTAARKLLADDFCRLGIVRTAHAFQRKETIIAQVPKRGTILVGGSAVVVTESLGPKRGHQPRRSATRRRYY
jgi:PASTA domain